MILPAAFDISENLEKYGISSSAAYQPKKIVNQVRYALYIIEFVISAVFIIKAKPWNTTEHKENYCETPHTL